MGGDFRPLWGFFLAGDEHDVKFFVGGDLLAGKKRIASLLN